LVTYDDLIVFWAASAKFETPANRDVHARHGAALSQLDKQRDAIEKDFEPVRSQMTGDRWHDIDVENANRDLLDRREAMKAKLAKLEGIRRALNNDSRTPVHLKGMSVDDLDREMHEVLSE
jgi:hypothetical protein